MRYEVQVQVDEGGPEKVWRSMQPSGDDAKPYAWATREEAERAARTFYPGVRTHILDTAKGEL